MEQINFSYKFPSFFSSGCDTKGCQEFCLNEGNGRGVCACRQGYYLKMDGVSCESECYKTMCT